LKILAWANSLAWPRGDWPCRTAVSPCGFGGFQAAQDGSRPRKACRAAPSVSICT